MRDAPSAGARRNSRWPLALTLLAAILAGLTAFVFFRLESWPARTVGQSTAELERVGRELRDAFVSIAHLQPRVTISDRVYFEQSTATTELALISRRTEVEHEFTHTWAGSTKRIKLHGTYNVKAGFDLRERFSVNVMPTDTIVEMPHAHVLTVEQDKIDVLAFENGYWNSISSADLQNEMSLMPQLARKKAEESKIADEAEAEFEKQLRAAVKPTHPIRVIHIQAAPPG